jgi:hypothetical protein
LHEVLGVKDQGLKMREQNVRMQLLWTAMTKAAGAASFAAAMVKAQESLLAAQKKDGSHYDESYVPE